MLFSKYYFKIIIAKDVNNPFTHVEENGCGSYTFDYIGDKAGDLKDKVVDWAKEKEKVKIK